MLSYLAQPEQRDTRPEIVKLLYSTRLAGDGHDQVLFLSRLMRVFGKLNQGKNDSGTIDLHLTDSIEPSDYVSSRSWLKIHNDRLTHQQLESNLGPTSGRKDSVVAYVCGPPAMTDEFVNVLQTQEGMKNRVFCEKWW